MTVSGLRLNFQKIIIITAYFLSPNKNPRVLPFMILLFTHGTNMAQKNILSGIKTGIQQKMFQAMTISQEIEALLLLKKIPSP